MNDTTVDTEKKLQPVLSISQDEGVPGPNDHHARVGADGTVTLHAGLGADEPSAKKRLQMRIAGQAKLDAIKAELADRADGLTAQEQELIKKQHDLAVREQMLEARERQVAAAAVARSDTPPVSESGVATDANAAGFASGAGAGEDGGTTPAAE